MPGATMPGIRPGLRPAMVPPTMPRPGVVPGTMPAPGSVPMPTATRPQPMPAGEAIGAEGGMEEGGMPGTFVRISLEFIGGMEGLQQIRERIMQDPAYLQQFLQQLQTANPQLYQLIQQNPQILMQLLMGGGAAPGHGAGHGQGGIQVTAEEKAAIDRVKTN